MVFSKELLFLIVVAAILCSCGFYKFLYFISIGYGAAIAGQGLFLLVYFHHLSWVTQLECVVLIFYGIRLAGYLLIRELKNNAYRNVLKTIVTDDTKMSFIAKLSIWLSCIILYATQVSPVFYGLYNKAQVSIASYIGLLIMIAGVALECIADYQKSKAKKKNPKRFCDKGLYKIVRCPNYLGEIVLWTGVLITGIDNLVSIGQWIVALIGYIGIFYVMLGGARRLEIRQDKSYGTDKKYRAYKSHTPILLPLIPLYSVKNWNWLKW